MNIPIKKNFNSALEKLRVQINQIDDEIMLLFGNRMKIAEKDRCL